MQHVTKVRNLTLLEQINFKTVKLMEKKLEVFREKVRKKLKHLCACRSRSDPGRRMKTGSASGSEELRDQFPTWWIPAPLCRLVCVIHPHGASAPRNTKLIWCCETNDRFMRC